MAFLKNIKDILGGSIWSLLIYALILFVFIIGISKCVLPVLHNRELLRRAIRNIRAGAQAKQSWQEDDFLGKGVLNSHWSEYLNNLFFADGVYHNASNVEDYINEETVIFGPGRGSFSEAIPGLLVSLGFLGTLIGLALGLSGFSMRDSDAVMESIVTLIPGMRYAFITSIFGVIGSLLFTFLTRMAHGSTQRTLRAFYGAMSRHAGVLSVDPMTQVAIYQQEQTMLIKKLSEDLSGKLGDNIATAVGRAVEPLNESLRSFVNINTREQMRFLDAVVTRFVERMDDTLQGQFKNLSRVLNETSQFQQDTLDSMRAAMDNSADMLEGIREVAKVCDNMVRANADYIADLRDNQEKTNEAFARVSSGIEQMELISRQQSGYLKSVSAMQAEVSRSMEQMSAALSNYSQRRSEQSASSSAGLLKAAAELRATGEQLRGIHSDCTAAINNELKLTLDAYQDYVNEFTRRVDQLAVGIVEPMSKLPRLVNDSANQFLDQIDRLTDTVAQAQQSLQAELLPQYDQPRRH